MITKITGEQPFQVLTNNFSISPSQEGYTLQISADGVNYSNLFTVGAGVTRLVTGVAANSFYRLSGNQSQVSINWMKTCVTEGGSGGAGNELTPVTEFPLGVEAGTVVALASGDTYGIYQYDGTDWNEARADVDLSAYWTSAETQSAITAVEDHLFDVEQVTASALTELHDGLLEVSGRTVDLSGYYTSGETDEAIAQAVSGLATEVYVDNAVADKLDSEDGRVISTALNALHDGLLEVSASTSGKADAVNISGGSGIPNWNSQGIVTGKSTDIMWADMHINGMNSFNIASDNSQLSYKIYAPTTSGNAGEVLVSTGNGAPVWSAVTGGGGDMSNYWNSAQTKSYVDSAATVLQDQLDTIDNVIPAAILDLNQKKVESQDVRYIVKLTQADYDQLVLDDDVDPDTFYIIVNSI